MKNYKLRDCNKQIKPKLLPYVKIYFNINTTVHKISDIYIIYICNVILHQTTRTCAMQLITTQDEFINIINYIVCKCIINQSICVRGCQL